MNYRALLLGVVAAVALQGVALAQTQAPQVRVANANPGDVRAMVTAAIRVPFDAVMTQARAAVGKPLVVEYGSARGNLKSEILAGQDFEVALLLPDVDVQTLAAGKILPGAYEIARVPIAFGLRGDAQVDVSTPAAVKKTLLAAKAVKYAPTGAALMTVKKVLGDLQIGDQIHDVSAVRDAVTLAPGEYEINIYPLSEILPNKALKNLGPVTPALQVPAIITATIGKNANDPAAARALIRFLQSPAIDAALKESGMVKGQGERLK